MSYMQFQQRCKDCEAEWNAAFGIIGMTQIAAPPKVCPRCNSENIGPKEAFNWPNLNQSQAVKESTACPETDKLMTHTIAGIPVRSTVTAPTDHIDVHPDILARLKKSLFGDPEQPLALTKVDWLTENEQEKK